MLETEVAETLMSLSAPDSRKHNSPLYAQELPWHTAPSPANSKKRSYNSFSLNVSVSPSSTAHTSPSSLASSLPTSPFTQSPSFSMFQHRIHERPLTSMIPARDCEREPALARSDDDSSSDVEMQAPQKHSSSMKHPFWSTYRSPLDGLCAAARDQAMTSPDESDSDYSSSSSRPIMIPLGKSKHRSNQDTLQPHQARSAPLSCVREDSYNTGYECSPTGVEDDREWFDDYRQSGDYRQRARLASVCSSDGGSEYGGLGRKHLEEFIRMEISNASENESQNQQHHYDAHMDGKYIGSYSPDARRKRIERFLEKRKRRVWSKKVDYDVRKNFANSRLRVKGRFVKKEDEELLCQMLSFT